MSDEDLQERIHEADRGRDGDVYEETATTDANALAGEARRLLADARQTRLAYPSCRSTASPRTWSTPWRRCPSGAAP